MNLKDYPRRRYSINQFTQPRCFELEGESFYFVMDDGYDYVLSILEDGVCELTIEGQTPKIEKYTCLKADDETYLLFHETTIDGYRTCITYVIDMEQRLVTILTCKVGLNPKFPLIVSSHFDFGAIRVDGEELTFKRHSYTDDLIGTMIEWHWGSSFFTRHSYYSTHHYRITSAREVTSNRAMSELAETVHTPSSDEWARYIKIKEYMYLFDLTEAYRERLGGAEQRWRCNNMAFLQNYDRMYHVGRHFGNSMIDGKVVPGCGPFGSFGKPVILDPDFVNMPNPYIV